MQVSNILQVQRNIAQTLAANSTPIVVRFLCSTPSEPTMASPKASNPHIFKHLSALEHTNHSQE